MTHSDRHPHSGRDRHQRYEDEMFRSPNPKRLFRSRNERILAGVCGGIGERYGWDPLVVRLVTVVAFFFLAGPLMLLGYLLMWMIVPKAPKSYGHLAPEEEAFWRGVSDRPKTTYSGLKYTFMDLEDRLQNLEASVTSDEWRLRREFRNLEKN
ncbi:envelope stress response membrane protein PspC [Henriciella sp.]|uniref:envelope stress response membrane protein PspC n=1 Tax=Henriciella sp. TaxID=1968823 RepID=UPI00182CF29C|nr:envelope stress response membrane protein PspC [Henriciella sp.]HIG23906.1 envelope stress response membrane protein PspC [Henriciella sp.]